ncbi:MAG: hypothetical protein HY508_07625 [Acidobacteria bacterium]|nr:hypothetical protein [Acidobacteriota bacterium]
MGPDQGIFLLHATRMVRGQLIYRDFFEFLTPGIDLVYFAFFTLFGMRAWIPNALLLLVGVTITYFVLAISKKVINGWVAYLPALMFPTLAMRTALDGTHHWYSSMFAMAGILAVIERRNPVRIAMAGTLFGLATFFTQSRGVVAALGLSAFLLWEAREKEAGWAELVKQELWLLSAFAGTLAALLAYFVWMVGLRTLVQSIVVFPALYYRADHANTFWIYMAYPPPLSAWSHIPAAAVWLFMYTLIPFVYFLFLVRYRREARALAPEQRGRLMLLNVTGIFLFLGIATAPGWTRLSSVCMPGLILMVWLISEPTRFGRAVTGLLAAVTCLITVLAPLKLQRRSMYFQEVPAGRVAWSHDYEYEVARWLQNHTQPGDFFFGGFYRDYYFPLYLQNPARVPFVVPNAYTRPDQVQDLIANLDKFRVRYVLWQPMQNRQSPGSNLQPLREYLSQTYHVVQRFSYLNEIWERNEPGAR